MARKRYEILTGLTAIQAAIYSEDNLPTALISDKNGGCPFSLHALRSESLKFFDDVFLPRILAAQNLDREKIDQLEVRLYKFFENFESQGEYCYGHYFSEKLPTIDIHQLDSIAEPKLCEDCA